MSDAYMIRLPHELKEKMRKYDINWSKEVRMFIEKRVRQLELLEVLKEVELRAKNRKVEIDSSILIREDRDNRLL